MNEVRSRSGVFMRDQLAEKANDVETGIINLDGRSGPGTHWVTYAVYPCGVVYFNSYGLTPQKEFLKYTGLAGDIQIWYSTLSTQTLTDPPICGPEVLVVLNAVSRTSAPLRKVIHEYTSRRHSHPKSF